MIPILCFRYIVCAHGRSILIIICFPANCLKTFFHNPNIPNRSPKMFKYALILSKKLNRTAGKECVGGYGASGSIRIFFFRDQKAGALIAATSSLKALYIFNRFFQRTVRNCGFGSNILGFNSIISSSPLVSF